MNYSSLLDLATDIGYELAMCGAETFRIEESINRILATYGVASEVFAIPNCLIVSIETPDGEPITRMRRIGYHGNDLDGVECFNAMSRAICNKKPSIEEARSWFSQIHMIRKQYSLPVYLLVMHWEPLALQCSSAPTFLMRFWQVFAALWWD